MQAKRYRQGLPRALRAEPMIRRPDLPAAVACHATDQDLDPCTLDGREFYLCPWCDRGLGAVGDFPRLKVGEP